jgi:hypothetical protein
MSIQPDERRSPLRQSTTAAKTAPYVFTQCLRIGDLPRLFLPPLVEEVKYELRGLEGLK